MSRRRLGLGVGRREVTLAGVELAGAGAVLRVQLRAPRTLGSSLEDCLAVLRRGLPAAWQGTPLHVALSMGELACGDIQTTPYCSEEQVERVGGVLAEGLCAGEGLEELAWEVTALGRDGQGRRVEVLGMLQVELAALRACLGRVFPGSELALLTSMPSALARAYQPRTGVAALAFETGGECVAVAKEEGVPTAWRSFPLHETGAAAVERAWEAARSLTARGRSGTEDAEGVWPGAGAVFAESDTSGAIPLGPGVTVVPWLAAAAAAALVEAEEVTNLLRGARDAPRGWLARNQGHVLLLAVAGAWMSMALGFYFERRTAQAEAEVQGCVARERWLWERVWPGEGYREGGLTERIQKALSAREKLAAGEGGSALELWAELCAALPDPERVGFRLESLSLSGEGGQLVGQVSRPEGGDQMAHALELERAVNASEGLRGRGDFERVESGIKVRLRIEPRAKAGVSKEPIRGRR